jgi:uncharacterized protein (DUF1330 family)
MPSGRRSPRSAAFFSIDATTTERGMVAYLIAEHKITDAAKFEEYRSKAAPIIERFGGRYLTRGGSHKILEKAHWQPDRVVVIEFPDMAALNAWYDSPEYQPLIALRQDAAIDMLITLEGA